MTARDLMRAARAAREPVHVSMTPAQAEELADRLERLGALADTAYAFYKCNGLAVPGDVWSQEDAEALGHLVTALKRVRP